MKKVPSKAISSIRFWLNDLLTRGQQNQLHLLFDHSLHVRAASSLIIGDYDLIMHSRKYDDILLTRLLVVNV